MSENIVKKVCKELEIKENEGNGDKILLLKILEELGYYVEEIRDLKDEKDYSLRLNIVLVK